MNERMAIREQFDLITRNRRMAMMPGPNAEGPKREGRVTTSWEGYYKTFDVGETRRLSRPPGSQMTYWANRLGFLFFCKKVDDAHYVTMVK